MGAYLDFLKNNPEYAKSIKKNNKKATEENRTVFSSVSQTMVAPEQERLERYKTQDKDFETYRQKGLAEYNPSMTGSFAVNDAERDVYGYLRGKYGAKEANKYLDEISRTLNARKREAQTAELQELWKDNKGDAVMRNIASAPFAGASYLAGVGQGVKNLVTGKNENIDVNAPAHGAAEMMSLSQEAVTKDMSGAGKFFANAGLSMAQNLATRLVTFGNPAAALGVMGASAAGQKFLENEKNGIELNKNLADSGIAGAIEAAAEKLPLDNLTKMIKIPKKTVSEFFKSLLVQAGLEGAEELATEYGTTIADNLMLGEQSDYNQYVKQLIDSGMNEADAKKKANIEFYAKNPALAFAGGAVSGTGFGIGGNIVGMANVKAVGEELRKTDGGVSVMMTALSDNYKDTKANEYAKYLLDRYNKKKTVPTATEIGRLYNSVEEQSSIFEKQQKRADALQTARDKSKSIVQQFDDVVNRLKGNFTAQTAPTGENGEEQYDVHTPEQIRVMQEYENAVDDELLEFVKYAKQNPNDNKSNLKLDEVTERLTRDIKNLAGVDVGGFSHAIKSNTITHINNEHGENGTTDHSMADEKDIARIKYVLENYDTIERLPTDSKEFRDKNQRPAPTVKLSKRIDGTVYVVEAVPDTKKGQLPIISAYKTKAVPQTRTAQMPSSDAQSASADTAFEDIISQSDTKSNTQNQQTEQLFDDTLNEEQRTAFTAEAQFGGKFNATAVAKTQSERKAQEVASKFGHSVVFYEGNDNGFLKGNTVYINKNAKNPVMAVAGHELVHAIMNDEALKKELIDFVKAENDVTKGFEKLFNNKKALYQSRMGEVSDDVVWEEIAADIGGDLFVNDEFISRITAEKPTLARRVLEFFRDLLARLRGDRRYSEISGDTIDYMRDVAKVAQKYEQAFIKARGNTGKSADTKFYIAENDGKKRVVVNTDITQGITEEILKLGIKKGSKDFNKQFKRKVRDYIKKHYKEISMPGTKYKTYVTERGAKEYVYSDDTHEMKGKPKYDKFRAADNIDEIVQAQSNSQLENTKHERKDNFVSFYRSDVEIQVLDRVYEAELITGLTSDGKEEFYDVVNWDLKKTGEPYHNPSSAETEFSGRPDSGSPVTEIVTQPSQEVKQSNENVKHSFSEDETPVSRFRTNTIERATMFTPEDLEAISPTEFEYIPESDKQWDEQAVKNVRADMEGVMEKIRSSEAMTSGTMSHEAALISKALTDRYHASGSAADLAALTDWLKAVAEKTRGTARALKATDTAWEKSPAAAVSKAQSEVDSQWAEYDEAHPKKAQEIKQKKKDIDKGISDAGKAGFDELIEEINRQQEKKQSRKKADGRTSRQRIRDKAFEKLNINESSGEGGKKQAAFVDRVLGDLFGKLKKTVKKSSGAKFSFDGWAHDIREAIQSRGEYAETWNEMYELAREEYAGDAEAMAVIDEYFRTGRPPLVPLKTMDEAIGKAFENSGVKLGDVVRDYFTNGEQTKQNLKDYIIAQTGLSGEDADVLSEYVAKRYDELVEKKQIEYLEREFSKNERPKVIDSEKATQLREHIDKVFEGNEKRKNTFYERVLGRVDMRIAQEIKAKNIDLAKIVKYGATATEKANYLYMKKLFSGLAGKVTRADIVQLQNVVYEEFARLSEVKNDKLLSKYFYNDTNGTTVVKNVRPKTEFGKILRLIEVAGRERADVIEEILRSEDGQPTLTENDVNAILNLMNSAEKISDKGSYAYKAKIAEVKKIIESKKKPAAWAAIKAYARINMLLNPKTVFTRNAGSNLLQSGIYNAENALGAAIDKGISKMYGTHRTTAMPSLKTQISGARQGLSEAIEDFRHGIDTRGFSGRYDIGEGSPFKGDRAISRALDKLNRTTGFLLDAGDRPFYEGYFRDVLRQQMEANNVTEPTEDMITIADTVALERTWQDENAFTDAFNGFKKALNGKMKFGLGDVIMPFVKTPANLLRATIQYSPAGLAKAITYDLAMFKKAVKDGSVTPQQQRRLVDNLSKGIAGTLVMLGGMALAGAGLYTGEDEEDARASSFKQYVEGIMPNSFEIGDTSVSLSWLQPLGGSLSFGATLFDELKKDNTMTEKLWNSFANSLENLVNASVIQGLREFFSGDFKKAMDSFAEAAKDAGTQMLPLGSLTKQTANAFDNTTRSTYATDEKGKYLNRIKQYYPGASNALEPRLNAFGEEIQRSPDNADEKLTLASGAERLFNSFFNPANMRKIKTSDLIDELNRVYDMTGDSRVYPSEADKSITYDGTTYKLTSEQYTSYQRSIGKKTKDLLGELINSDKTVTELVGEMSEDGAVYYADLSEDEQKSKLTSVKTRAANEYKESIGKKNVKIDDLSASEERQLRKAQDEAVKRFKNGEPYETQIEWSDVPYSQLDDVQKAEVIAKAITNAKKKAKEEMREDVEKNARPVFKGGG